MERLVRIFKDNGPGMPSDAAALAHTDLVDINNYLAIAHVTGLDDAPKPILPTCKTALPRPWNGKENNARTT